MDFNPFSKDDHGQGGGDRNCGVSGRGNWISRDRREWAPRERRGGRRGFGRGFKRGGHPGHLRGREIGLYFRDLGRRSNNSFKMPLLNLPAKSETTIQRWLKAVEGEEEVAEATENVFRDEYLDITTVSFSVKLTQCLEVNMRSILPEGLDEELHTEHLNKNSNREYAEMLEFRKKLPAYLKRDAILKTIRENQVAVISGDTGCGKTTQVGQMILEEACAQGRGARVRVLLTQPRRLAATSIAARVAKERGEDLGISVGYCIRLDSIPPREHGCLEVVTAGVVLQRLQRDPALLSVSHLLLDEVHERDTTVDILLGVVKQILTKRKDLKLILMSATMEAERFSQYFEGCPLLHIPGFMFPIKEFFLEDVLEMTNFVDWPMLHIPVNGGRKGPWKKRRMQMLRNERARAHEEWICPFIQKLNDEGNYSEETLTSLLKPESEELCEGLMVALIINLCHMRPPGAILVFLPGLANITRLCRLLEEQAYLLPRHLVVPLHSLLNSVDQNAVFQRPPEGVRKIIVSTNIAETSITIDDVVYVIDCGRMKLGGYDVELNVQTLQAEWVSKANAQQRRGRAGRVSAGECYRLYSKWRAEILPERPAPELLRAPVHEPLLTALLLRLHPAPVFLASLLDPPHPAAVETAVILLRRMGILDEMERLTPLGVHVARLPVAPGAARMLLLAAMFSTMAPVSSMAAVVAFKDPFVLVIGKEREVEEARRQLAAGSDSDQLAAAEAQRRWAELPRYAADAFCQRYFLSSKTLRLLADMRQQFAQLLYKAKFLASPDPDCPQANRHEHKTALLKALVVAGLYPNVAVYKGKGTNLRTLEDGKVTLHPSSVNKSARCSAQKLVYRLKQRSTDLFLHDTSPAHAIPLIFFAETFQVTEEGMRFSVVKSGDHFWRMKRETAELLRRMRGALHRMLQLHLENPHPIQWDKPEGNLLKAIIELITAEDDPIDISDEEEEDNPVIVISD